MSYDAEIDARTGNLVIAANHPFRDALYKVAQFANRHRFFGFVTLKINNGKLCDLKTEENEKPTEIGDPDKIASDARCVDAMKRLT